MCDRPGVLECKESRSASSVEGLFLMMHFSIDLRLRVRMPFREKAYGWEIMFLPMYWNQGVLHISATSLSSNE